MIQDQGLLGKNITQISFSEAVEAFMQTQPCETYIQATMAVMDELDLDLHDVPKLLSVALRDKIELEAVEAGQLVRSSSPMITFE